KERTVRIAYIYSAGKEKQLDIIEDNLNQIIEEKALKFKLERIMEIEYTSQLSGEYLKERIQELKSNIVLLVDPDGWDKDVGQFLRTSSIPFQVITQDNIDKKFRYLNLITDIAILLPLKHHA
ncbi:MAG TPA: hypothetical protein VJC03_07480, partial [bacterium]|nr:hypothetical protein [bacterium]